MSGDDGRHRLGMLAVTALSLFGALFARLWYLQVVQGPSLAAQATRNATRTVVIPAPRGRILDRNGIVLVDDRDSIVASISTQDYDKLDPSVQAKLLRRLAHVLSANRAPGRPAITVKFLRTRLNDSRFTHFRPVPVATDITAEQEIMLKEGARLYPTVVVDHETVRSYPYGSLAAHLLGYVGPLSDPQWQLLSKHNSKDKPYVQNDEIGKSGVESQYESLLRGTPGRRVYEVDRANRIVGEITSKRVAPKQGDDVYLSIDARVQYKAESALQGRIVAAAKNRKTPAKSGGLVVLDPSNGEVRAMASYPTYDPADLVGGISCPEWRTLQGLDPNGSCKDTNAEIKAMPSDQRPVSELIDRALQGTYAPASTYKLATSYAAMKYHLINPTDFIDDPGYIKLCGTNTTSTGCVKHDAGGEIPGSVNLTKALTVSSDVYFYRLGAQAWYERGTLGDTAMQQAMEELGYGHRTGIDLPGESAGVVPTPDSELAVARALFKDDPAAYDNKIENALSGNRWNPGTSADLAIGQKTAATPLQIAVAYASLANGGTLWKPTVFDHATPAYRPKVIVQQVKPTPTRHIDWGSWRQPMLDGFRGVVDPNGALGQGTAVRPFQGFPFSTWPMAGKTGTAQTGKDKLGNEKPDNSMFVGFQLGDDSQWLAAAAIDSGGAGADAAAPTVRLTLEPIATGDVWGFTIPANGTIDAQQVADATAGIQATGND